jgi:hypothetical protein
MDYGDSLIYPCAGIIQIRFDGYDLRLPYGNHPTVMLLYSAIVLSGAASTKSQAAAPP